MAIQLLTIFLVMFVSYTQGCTEFIVSCKDAEETVIIGRTMEFAQNPPWKIVSAPKGTPMKVPTASGCKQTDTLKWKSKHKILYVIGDTDFVEDTPNFWLDGQNDAGLSIGALYFDGYSKYPEQTEVVANNKCDNAIAHTDLVKYVLSKFSS